MATSLDYDDKYGAPRPASQLQPHETDQVPVSLVRLNHEIGASLRMYQELAQCPLMQNALTSLQLIWVMDEECQFWVAFEEIALEADHDGSPPPVAGYPRRKSEFCPKLGHPTLLSGGHARIAGELLLDQAESGGVEWIMNFNSGRYCRDPQLVQAHKDAVHQEFCMLVGLKIRLDDEL